MKQLIRFSIVNLKNLAGLFPPLIRLYEIQKFFLSYQIKPESKVVLDCLNQFYQTENHLGFCN